MKSPTAGKRIVLTTFGWLGDFYPYLVLGQGLRRRGHQVVLATNAAHRERVQAAGLEFHPVRPDLPSPEAAPEAVRRAMNPRTGSDYLMRQMLMPTLREQYEDLCTAARGADLLITHMGTYAAPPAAEKLGVPLVTVVLQPQLFLSAYDPPAPAAFPLAVELSRLGPTVTGAVLRWAKGRFGELGEPIQRLRSELGLPRSRNPLFEGQYSPLLNLACFSSRFGPPQPDWPAHTCQTGFLHPDGPAEPLPPELEAFLDSGPPPVVFTLGSLLVWIGDTFFQESIEAARRLKSRAVFLVGPGEFSRPLPAGGIACAYASHAALFPRAAAVVHHGGIGTTAEALRAGCPSLVVPYCHDQPDNARRVRRLGMGRVLPWGQYRADRVERELRHLLAEPARKETAAALAAELRREDGVGAAVAAIEECMASACIPFNQRIGDSHFG